MTAPFGSTGVQGPTLYHPDGHALPQGIGRAIAMMAERGVDVAYRAGSTKGQDLAAWMPAQTSADAGWLWTRDLAVARVRNLIANEPWAQAAVDRRLELVVGAGWRPSIKPDAEALGISEVDAAALGRSIERAWRMWAEDPLCRCDAAEQQNGAWLFHTAVMEHEVTGDGLGVLRFNEREDWQYRTQLQLVDSDRLSNPFGKPDALLFKGGIELNDREVPIAYHFRNAHPGEMGIAAAKSFTWTRVERREPWGRPKVLHLFRKDRPGQSRGIPKLAAALARFKSLQRFAETELKNAIINALFAATITSGFDPAVVQEQLTDTAIAGYHSLRNSFYDTSEPRLGDARVQHLFPGDELKFNASPRQTAAFDQFTTVFLRAIASALGLSYEQLTMDWTKTNYSSARAALVEVWRSVVKQRALVAMGFAWPLLLAVTEDAIDAGLIKVPAGCAELYEMPAAWLRGAWIGPPRGYIDQVKEAQGALMRIGAGLSDWETEAAEQGQDFELLVTSLARQKEMWDAAGLAPPSLKDMLAVEAPSDIEAERTAA